MPLTFHEADTLFRQDKLNELVADSEGRRFLKLRSLNRTEYLERLFRMADIPRPDVGMAIESEITLTNQERGKEWEYRVIAVNKSGEGQPSNTVMAVL